MELQHEKRVAVFLGLLSLFCPIQNDKIMESMDIHALRRDENSFKVSAIEYAVFGGKCI